MKILDAEIEFDFNDADDMERFEKELDIMAPKLQEIKTVGRKRSVVIREFCEAVLNCLDNTFGEGTSKKVFGERTNLTLCIKAFEDLCIARDDYDKEFEKQIKELESKYSPSLADRG